MLFGNRLRFPIFHTYTVVGDGQFNLVSFLFPALYVTPSPVG
jgi:hypothetical protein